MRRLRFGGRIVQKTGAGVVVAAYRRERAVCGTGEGDQLLHDAQYQLRARGDGEFFEEAVQMCVNGVFRDFEPPGNPRLGQIIKDPLDNLQFPLREAQSAASLSPSLVG